MQWALVYPRTAAPHAIHEFLCTYTVSEQRVSQAAGIAAQRSRSRHVHIANDDTKQLQDSKQMHVCFSPELFSS